MLGCRFVKILTLLLLSLGCIREAQATPANPEVIRAFQGIEQANSALKRNLGEGLWGFCQDPNVSEGAKRIFQRLTGLTAKPCVPLLEESSGPKTAFAQSYDKLKEGFLAWIVPIAVYLQEKTGMPASVMIAQAALETGWGVSFVFRRINNSFGHSCFRRGRRKTFRLLLGARKIQFTASCSHSRPSWEGAYYLRFQNPIHSVYAYAYNLLYDPATQEPYGKLRELIEKTYPERAKAADVVASLQAYATDREYQRKLLKMIEYNELERYDDLESCL